MTQYDWIIRFYLDPEMDTEWRNEKALLMTQDQITSYMRSEMHRERFIEVAVATRRDNPAIQVEVSR